MTDDEWRMMDPELDQNTANGRSNLNHPPFLIRHPS
jgi:hypothetical protein